jgi:threonylcarbamoyladenosine tRNA methylthiotransferase MtaB
MTSFSIRNFGCRVNQAEAFGWVEELRKGGLRLEEDPGRGDYLLVNSCTLTGRADRDVRRFVQRAARENPDARIVVTGCLSGAPPKICAGCRASGSSSRTARSTPGGQGDRSSRGAERRGDRIHSSGFVPFRARASHGQDGCDFHCAYCVIPAVRGRGRASPGTRSSGA